MLIQKLDSLVYPRVIRNVTSCLVRVCSDSNPPKIYWQRLRRGRCQFIGLWWVGVRANSDYKLSCSSIVMEWVTMRGFESEVAVDR